METSLLIIATLLLALCIAEVVVLTITTKQRDKFHKDANEFWHDNLILAIQLELYKEKTNLELDPSEISARLKEKIKEALITNESD